MQILRGKQPSPRRVLLYGQEGSGKSTWATKAPRPIFLDFENGLNDLDVEKTPRLATYSDTIEVCKWLFNSDHQYKSVIFDTVDWFEKLLRAQVCANNRVNTIEEVGGGYGKGFGAAESLLSEFLVGLNALHHVRRLNIILLGHCQRIKVSDPGMESYEQFSPDLDKRVAAVFREWCDEVFFVSFRTFLRQEDAGFNRKRSIAIGDDERYVRTTHAAGVQAKNRLSLPAELPLDWTAYEKFWPVGTVTPTAAGNIEGIVRDGSSKTQEQVIS